jgi:peptidoglycan/LPS O-acetylase OafA/YrhL
VATFRGVWFRRLFRSPLIVTIGGMCYTIYLLHSPIVTVLGGTVKRLVSTPIFTLHLLCLSMVVIPPLLAICGLYFAFIERPCMRKGWPTRLWLWLTTRR